LPDTEGFDELYRASRDRLAVQLAALTGNSSDADDVVQEAFMRAWLRWGTIGDYDDPEAWVRRVAHNLAVSRWRRARKLVLRASVPIARTESPGQRIPILAALQALPVAERRAIVLHHVAGLPVAEVAIDLGAPEGTVKSWLSRGRTRLATELDRLEHEPRQHEERPPRPSDMGDPRKDPVDD
jgi:RNA polymerase sigma-70 factor (sigma-E family)